MLFVIGKYKKIYKHSLMYILCRATSRGICRQRNCTALKLFSLSLTQWKLLALQNAPAGENSNCSFLDYGTLLKSNMKMQAVFSSKIIIWN
jgi:hypothetical protein